MLIRLSRWLLVLTLTLSIGAHWALLQSVAWLGMIVTYSRDASLTEALSKTFDGKHPCRLCKAITKGKRTEKKSEVQTPPQKLEFAHAASSFVLDAPSCLPERSPATSNPRTLAYPPLTPPPRRADA
ncbi:MAG: hypothetical protein C5B50_18355 [Verrucomicrobia bacterium]|nr:MAG: hypothetical protein C5B50_18355 [Verrucomicrobiota bacterium]